RHLAGAEALVEQRLARLSSDDRRARIAALDRETAKPEIQSAAQLLTLAVAVEAIGSEQRSNVRLESRRRCGRRFFLAVGRRTGEKDRGQAQGEKAGSFEHDHSEAGGEVEAAAYGSGGTARESRPTGAPCLLA